MADAKGLNPEQHPKLDREAHRGKLSEHDADQIDAALKIIKDIADANQIEPLHIHTLAAQFIDPHRGGGPGS